MNAFEMTSQYPTGSNEWYAAMYLFATPTGKKIIANTLAARHNNWTTEYSKDGTEFWFVAEDGTRRP